MRCVSRAGRAAQLWARTRRSGMRALPTQDKAFRHSMSVERRPAPRCLATITCSAGVPSHPTSCLGH
jgi:hypothetical protein